MRRAAEYGYDPDRAARGQLAADRARAEAEARAAARKVAHAGLASVTPAEAQVVEIPPRPCRAWWLD